MVFVELEKKGTAGGRSASERGDEPRSGTLYLLKNTPASDSIQPTKKETPKGLFFCGAGEERNCLWPFRQRARRRAEERNTLYFSLFSYFRLHPAHKKRDPKRSLSFVELEGATPPIIYFTDNLLYLQSLFPDRSQILTNSSPFIYLFPFLISYSCSPKSHQFWILSEGC